jgi:hypothetical protein
MLKYFTGSFVFTIIGLIASYFVGHYYGGSMSAGFEALFIAGVLAVLEISLSFDNAIVNAVVLKKMTPVWRHRFLTWGMVIAVFGMRLVFPLLIVTVMAHVNPWEALMIAATKPDEYARMMLAAHLEVAAFGGTFLLMVTLNYFYDPEKDTHWIEFVEKPVSLLGRVKAIEIALTLIILTLLVAFLPEADQLRFLKAGMAGLITYVIVDGIGSWLEFSEGTMPVLGCSYTLKC